MRAHELNRLGRRREALDVLDRILAVEPNHVRALNLRAVCLAQLGEHDAAIAAARASVAAAPQNGHSFWALSFALDLAGRAADSVEAAATAVRLAPDAAINHVRLAEALLDINPPASVAPVERARQLAPDAAVVHLACGTVYEANRRLDEARRSFLLALEIDPQNAAAHLRIARLDKKANKWEAALRGFSRAVSLNPRSSNARRQIEAVILAQLWPPMLAAFAGAMAVSLRTAGDHPLIRHVVGAVALGVVGGTGFVTIRGLRRSAGGFLWHFLRTDRQAHIVLALISAYVGYIVIAAETPLIPVGWEAYKVVGVLLLRFLADRLSARVGRRGAGQPSAGRKRQQQAGAQQLKDGAEA